MFELRIPSLRAALALTTLSAAALLAACGGGGGSAGSTPLGAAPDVTYSQGAIAGFGSIIVGGVRYDDSSATVEDEDGNRNDDKSSLKLGVMVQIDAGAVNNATGTAVARRVRFGNEIVGPVGTITVDAAGTGTVVVLGQTVAVTASTVFDDSLSGGLSALTAGEVIEVHGILNQTTQQIVATRIEDKLNATSYRLRGVVAALDTTAKTYKIGSETISYASLLAADLPVNLANGQVVRTQLQTAKDANGNWVATKLRSGKREAEGNRGEAHVEGIITDFVSLGSFKINGLEVNAGGTGVIFEDGTAGIVAGARVEVEGSIVNGVLVARKVEIEDRRNSGKRQMELHGVIGSLNTDAKTFALRGVTVSYASASFVRGTAANLAASTAPRVEVKGTLSTDRTRLEATTVKFED